MGLQNISENVYTEVIMLTCIAPGSVILVLSANESVYNLVQYALALTHVLLLIRECVHVMRPPIVLVIRVGAPHSCCEIALL